MGATSLANVTCRSVAGTLPGAWARSAVAVATMANIAIDAAKTKPKGPNCKHFRMAFISVPPLQNYKLSRLSETGLTTLSAEFNTRRKQCQADSFFGKNMSSDLSKSLCRGGREGSFPPWWRKGCMLYSGRPADGLLGERP